MNSKKAQGLSINTIVIAVIVLVVLIVLILVFTGYFGKWTGSTKDCSSQGGTCVSEGCGKKIPINAECPDSDDNCCSTESVINFWDCAGECKTDCITDDEYHDSLNDRDCDDGEICCVTK